MSRDDAQTPRALESEQILLGVLARGLHVDEILKELRPEHCFRRDHGLVLQAAETLAGRGVTPDAMLIARELDGALDGGPAYVCKLADYGIGLSELGIAEHARIVREAWAAGSAINLLEIHRKRLYQKPAVVTNGMASDLAAELEQIKREALGNQPDIAARFQLLDDVELLNRPEPIWIVKGRILKNSIGCIYAPPEVGKTTAMVDLGCSIATGSPWLGAATTAGPVVYVAAEGADTIQLKVRAWKRTHGYSLDEPIYFCTIPTAVNLLDAGDTTAFIESIKAKALHPVLVVFDTLARSMPGGDENSARDMGLVVSNADRVRTAFDATVILPHHTDKQEKHERGSGALRGACDTMMQLVQTDDQLRLLCTKQKDATRFPPVDVQMVPTGGGCVMQLATDAPRPAGLSDTQRKALHALRFSFTDEGATTTEWQAAMPDVIERTYYRAKKVLVDSGYVRMKGQRFLWTGKVPESESLTLTDMPTDTAPDRQ